MAFIRAIPNDLIVRSNRLAYIDADWLKHDGVTPWP